MDIYTNDLDMTLQHLCKIIRLIKGCVVYSYAIQDIYEGCDKILVYKL